MTPRIINANAKKLIGIRITLSIAQDKTAALWKSFMPRRKEIPNPVSKDLISLQLYPSNYFNAFHPTREFEKWACIEVTDFDQVPIHMEPLLLSGGLYAVFDYKGSSTDTSIFQYIFGSWLPDSDYKLDDRPHFEVLGERYKNNDPSSEEEIWIPIMKKSS